MYTPEQHDALSKIAEFEHVFMVNKDGDVSKPTFPTLYAPEALDVDPNATELDGWQLPLSGLTGQYGYSGPWLHDSEVIPGAVAEAVLSKTGYWVAIYGQHTMESTHKGHRAHFTGAWFCDTCNSPYCEEEPETDIEGWTMAYKPFAN